MIDREALHLLIYQHVVQLTLLDHPIAESFDIAYEVAARAFDDGLMDVGLMIARQSLGLTYEDDNSADSLDDDQRAESGRDDSDLDAPA